ncbi:mRNA interferase MazF [Lachnospiraceae bacterium PF1-21]
MRNKCFRGDMFIADLEPVIGSEQGGRRPVIIIQNNVGNRHSPTIIVAPITSKSGIRAVLPTHHYVKAVDGLNLPSIILLEQIRTIDKKRLKDYIGQLNKIDMRQVDLCIAVSLELEIA